MLLAATDRGLCALTLGDDAPALLAALQAEYPKAHITAQPQPYPPQLQQWLDELDRHLRGRQPDLQLPLDLRATAFQIQVWNYLRAIPYGETRSYAEVAEGIGKPSAVRAVASACARNRVALVIPCHRVIRGTGHLGGYRWGLARKQSLLQSEHVGAGPGQPAPEAITS
jgi:AraC family transcriptional regulator of adaptative response/methylated-DNA-[protein]-cysteine methyltransferase